MASPAVTSQPSNHPSALHSAPDSFLHFHPSNLNLGLSPRPEIQQPSFHLSTVFLVRKKGPHLTDFTLPAVSAVVQILRKISPSFRAFQARSRHVQILRLRKIIAVSGL